MSDYICIYEYKCDKYIKCNFYYYNNYNEIISNASIISTEIKNTFTLLTLHTEVLYRGNGCATKILKHIIEYCKLYTIKKLILDDCTDNFNMNNNIYINCGFKYIEKNLPEMELIIN